MSVDNYNYCSCIYDYEKIYFNILFFEKWSKSDFDWIKLNSKCSQCNSSFVSCDCLDEDGERKLFTIPLYLENHFLAIKKKSYRRKYDNRKNNTRKVNLVLSNGFYTDECINKLSNIQENSCYFCLKNITNGYQIDHLTPVSKEGSQWVSNLALVCADCNRRKYNTTEAVYWKKSRKIYGDSVTDSAREKLVVSRKEKRKLTETRKKEFQKHFFHKNGSISEILTTLNDFYSLEKTFSIDLLIVLYSKFIIKTSNAEVRRKRISDLCYSLREEYPKYNKYGQTLSPVIINYFHDNLK